MFTKPIQEPCVLKNKYGITDFEQLEQRITHDAAKAVVSL
ncbi:hypothetical protein PU02_0231 [Bartonella ancashensis]|uniref:Uncharacterized protein n=1 Tax=Bartonella ancashensis TaxID=1318743 RepID=A0A0M3T2N5_9HYPH|nr:hypothetical protein PU02_0231 [Bartonella ancashensis]